MEVNVNTQAAPEAAISTDEQILSALKKIAADSEETRKSARRSALFSLVRTVCAVAFMALIAVVVICRLPIVDASLTNLNEITTELNQVDYITMTESVTTMATQGSEGITFALEGVDDAIAVIDELDVEGLNAAIADFGEAVNKLDIETLNKSIKDFSNVVSPMARFFGVLK